MLPSPYDYSNWQDFAAALISALGDGSTDVIAGGVGGNAGGSSSGVPPTGFEPVYWNPDLGNLFTGDSFVVAPPTINPFQIDTQSLALASVELNQIADGAVGTNKLQDLAVVNSKIANATILTAKIGDAQIVEAKIADLAVNTAKIADLAVSTAKIGALQVTTGKIQDLAVSTAKIALLAVTAAQIAAATITTAKIGAAQITTALIADAAILSAKIGVAEILTANIGALQVTTGKISDLAVTSAKIADLAVTNAKIASLVINKVTAGTLDAEIDMGTGLIRFIIGGNRLTLGKGFGSSSQFIMWFGPSMAESAMTEGAAIFYLKTNGDAYFGGSLTAGTLHNSRSTTSLSATAEVETGDFSSNGNPRKYTASYVYDHRSWRSTNGTSGSMSVDLILEKWNGASWDNLGTLPLTGSVVATFNDPDPENTGDEFWDMRATMSGSVSFTDNSGGLGPFNIRARIANRNIVTFTGSIVSAFNEEFQRVTVTSAED